MPVKRGSRYKLWDDTGPFQWNTAEGYRDIFLIPIQGIIDDRQVPVGDNPQEFLIIPAIFGDYYRFQLFRRILVIIKYIQDFNKICPGRDKETDITALPVF